METPQHDAPMPAPLQRLLDEYERIVANYEQNLLSYEQAMQTILTLSAVDPEGKVWTLDENKVLWVRAHPQSSPVRADTSMWPVSPAPALHSGSSVHREPAALPAGRAASPAARYGADDVAPEPRRARAPRERPTFDWAEYKGRIIAGAALVVMVAAVFVFGRSSGEDPDGPVTSSPITLAPPVTDGPTTVTVAPAKGDEAPDAATVNGLFTELASGDATRTAAVIDQPGTAARQALTRAFWAGTLAAGVDVRPDAVAALDPDKENVARQAWTIRETATGETVATVKVRYKFSDGEWKFQTWPTVTEVEPEADAAD